MNLILLNDDYYLIYQVISLGQWHELQIHLSQKQSRTDMEKDQHFHWCILDAIVQH